MLDNCATPEERWTGVQSLINRWLDERQELVVIYCSLCGTPDFSNDCERSLAKLKTFCEILVDYVSAGHFEVYDQLQAEAEAFQDGSEQRLQELYPAITETTQRALDFNDIYDTEEHCQQALGQLKDKLSALGEQLETRFELEDVLIQELHNAHAAATA